MRRLLVALLLLASGAAQPEQQRWSAIEYYYKPEALGSLEGRIFSLESLRAGKPRPLGTLHFIHGEYGDPAFPEQVPENCSAFQTGAGSGQDTDAAGWVMNTECAALSPDPAHRFVNMQANITWAPEQMPRPWVTESSRFGLEFSLRLPSARVSGGAKAYATAQVAIHDGEGRLFWFQPTLFLAGFAPGAEKQDTSGLDQKVPYINPVYRDRGRYMSKFDNPVSGQVSHVTTVKPWSSWRWYAFTISRTQLRNAVGQLNANGAQFSTNLSRYGVSLIGVQTEINRQATDSGKTPQGLVGIGLKQIYAYRLD